jgi:hypothetical protein
MIYMNVNGAQQVNGLGIKQAKARKGKLTNRGKAVIAILYFVFWGLLFNATTPDQCKVPVEQMNQWCIDLIYP